MSWIKLNLSYLGKSKKHHIFRAKKWSRNLEKITHKPVFNEDYEELGVIKEIFGPIKLPFISVKASSNYDFASHGNFYVKLKK